MACHKRDKDWIYAANRPEPGNGTVDHCGSAGLRDLDLLVESTQGAADLERLLVQHALRGDELGRHALGLLSCCGENWSAPLQDLLDQVLADVSRFAVESQWTEEFFLLLQSRGLGYARLDDVLHKLEASSSGPIREYAARFEKDNAAELNNELGSAG